MAASDKVIVAPSSNVTPFWSVNVYRMFGNGSPLSYRLTPVARYECEFCEMPIAFPIARRCS